MNIWNSLQASGVRRRNKHIRARTRHIRFTFSLQERVLPAEKSVYNFTNAVLQHSSQLQLLPMKIISMGYIFSQFLQNMNKQLAEKQKQIKQMEREKETLPKMVN